jgi:hypothetical protein
MRYPKAATVVLWMLSPLAAAQCIEVQEETFDLATNEIGSATVEWEAQLTNQCRKTLDADVKIHLLDRDEQPVYELLDKITVGMQETRMVGKEVYIPSRIVDEVDGFVIEIVERERQF